MFIEIGKAARGWRFIVKGENGELVLHSQTYYSRWNATRSAMKLAKQNNMEVRLKRPMEVKIGKNK